MISKKLRKLLLASASALTLTACGGGGSGGGVSTVTNFVTNDLTNHPYGNSIIVDIDFEEVSDGTLTDNSGNDILGIFITDYSLNFTKDDLEPSANDTINQVVLSSDVKRKAY